MSRLVWLPWLCCQSWKVSVSCHAEARCSFDRCLDSGVANRSKDDWNPCLPHLPLSAELCCYHLTYYYCHPLLLLCCLSRLSSQSLAKAHLASKGSRDVVRRQLRQSNCLSHFVCVGGPGIPFVAPVYCRGWSRRGPHLGWACSTHLLVCQDRQGSYWSWHRTSTLLTPTHAGGLWCLYSRCPQLYLKPVRLLFNLRATSLNSLPRFRLAKCFAYRRSLRRPSFASWLCSEIHLFTRRNLDFVA